MKKLLSIFAAIAIIFTVVVTAPISAETSAVEVGTIDELRTALNEGKDVVFKNDIKGDAVSGGYSVAGAVQSKGQTIDGNGFTLTVTNANDTYGSGIYTNGGVIKNLTVKGSFRGIFSAGLNTNLTVENVGFEDVVYTFNSDGANKFDVVFNGCSFNGWTSFTGGYTSVTFNNCTFGEGSGYAYLRPYQATTFNFCDFEEGYTFDGSRAEGHVFNYCNVNGEKLFTENMKTLLGSSAVNSVANNTKVEMTDKTEANLDEENMTVVDEELNNVINNVVTGEETSTTVSEGTEEKIKEAIEEGKAVTTKVVVEVVEEDEVVKEDLALLETTLDDKDGEVAMILNIEIAVLVDGEAVGNVEELSKPITFEIIVPSEIVKEGRTFYVVRVHDGKTDVLELTHVDGNVYSFTTNKFSTYALAYTDAKVDTPVETPTETPKAPETGDATNVAGLLAMLIASAYVVTKKVRA